jgi:hypothetical protein
VANLGGCSVSANSFQAELSAIHAAMLAASSANESMLQARLTKMKTAPLICDKIPSSPAKQTIEPRNICGIY